MSSREGSAPATGDLGSSPVKYANVVTRGLVSQCGVLATSSSIDDRAFLFVMTPGREKRLLSLARGDGISTGGISVVLYALA